MKYKAKSVVVSRKPNHDEDESWSAFIGLFNENNPHLKAKVPFKIIEIPQVEKVRVTELRNISFYLRGNDLVINNLKEINIETEDKIVTLTGRQEFP